MSTGLCAASGLCWEDEGCPLHGSGMCPRLVEIPAEARERIVAQARAREDP